MGGKTHHFEPQVFMLTYGPNAPAITVGPGDTVVARTVDAARRDERGEKVPPSRLQSRDDLAFCESNPLVGPIAVEGAVPGDVLAVKIVRIAITRTTATSSVLAGFGLGAGEGPGKKMSLTPPMAESNFVWNLDLQRNSATIKFRRSRQKSVTIPLDPFIGSIGVAPRFGRVETALTPGEYGGNMDCPDAREGTTIYFPVFVRGGLLAFGDIHAAQGDGEYCGVALETTAEVTLNVRLLKQTHFDWPRMEDKNWLMTVGSARPLLDAYRLAYYEMVRWLVDDYGFDRSEAIQLLSQAGRSRIGNVCDPNFSIECKFPKSILK
jgi:amidase